MTLNAAFEALNNEGKEWGTTSTALSDAAQQVAGLTLTSDDFGWGGSVTGLTDVYAQVQAHVAGYLQGGVAETAKLAEALPQVAKDFQSADQGVVSAVQALWVPE